MPSSIAYDICKSGSLCEAGGTAALQRGKKMRGLGGKQQKMYALQPSTSCFGLSGGAHFVSRTSMYAWSAPTKPCTAWFCPRRWGYGENRRRGLSLGGGLAPS